MRFNSVLSNLKNYEAGKPIELVVREYGINENDVIKLASNENPFGASPLVVDILKDSAKYASLYPDDSYFELKQALADKFNISSKNLIIGAGSDQIIELVSRALLNEKMAILTAGVTFAMYEIYARQMGADVIKTDSLTHDPGELYELYNKHKDRIGIIFLCIPNNPLGECLDKDEVYKFIQNISDDTLVVVDAAYNDFAKFKDAKKGIEPLELITKFKNSIFLGTFSKSYGLGGMRVGYGIANDELICELGKLRPPFNITTLSLKAAIYALKDDEFVLDCIKSNFEQMKRYESLANEVGVEYIPSYTNFITFKFHLQSSDEIGKNLLKKGIILRNLNSYGLNAIRITIGTQIQNDRVLQELRDILK